MPTSIHLARSLVKRSMMTSQSTTHRIAILDDYLGIAQEHFTQLPHPVPPISVFRDTLPAWTHPSTEDSSREALVIRLEPFTIISTMRERTPFPAALLSRLPKLKLLLCTGTQFNTIDVATAKDLGITVVAAPGRGRSDRPKSARTRGHQELTKGATHPTTQHTWSLILALARNITIDDSSVRTGGWQTSLAVGLTGKVLGIVGLGRLGASTARIGVLAWGMQVICWSANLTQEKADKAAEAMGLPVEIAGGKTFLVVDKERLFAESDVVSVHYVLSERSKGIIGRRDLEAMKPEALLVNTSRGPLIDEDDLLEVLNHGKIQGAALDVYDIEPLPVDSRWRTTAWGIDGRSKVILTPHTGYVDKDLMHAWYDETAENVERFLQGQELLHRIA